MLFDALRLPSNARNALIWRIVLLSALFAWLPVLYQEWEMRAFFTPMPGPMGLSPGLFVIFWTIMTVAMMLPTLAPILSMRYEKASRRNARPQALGQLCVFLLGYLSVWAAFGIPVFLLALLGEWCLFHSPEASRSLGLGLLILAGLYQMLPLEKRLLRHCNPALTLCCPLKIPARATLLAHLKGGLTHGAICLGSCGALMLVMIAVGLMNLFWMALISLLIFLEKSWQQGERLSFFIGFGLLIFAAMAAAEPALLPGLYSPGL